MLKFCKSLSHYAMPVALCLFVVGTVHSQHEIKLTASDAAANDQFGWAVSFDDTIAVVGAPFDDDAGNSSGAAYVYERTATGQIQEIKLTASDADASDQFGRSVSIRDKVIVIGAPEKDDGAVRSGAAYVFERTQAGWQETAKLTASDAMAEDNFGMAVAVDGNLMVIGASNGDGVAQGSGAAYVFRRTMAGWVEEAKLFASDGAFLDFFGLAASISDSTVVVGADGDDDAGSATGAAYVFHKTASGWIEEARLVANDAEANDFFGIAVDIDNDFIVVGANHQSDVGLRNGAAYVFRRVSGGWIQEARLEGRNTEPDDSFGSSVSISGSLVLAGSPGADGRVPSSGAAYVFRRTASGWRQLVMISASDASTKDAFGASVSIDGSMALVGAPLDSDGGQNSGSAYVYFAGRSVSKQSGAAVTAPTTFALLQNYPNPFNPATSLRFVVPESEEAVRVSLRIYDITGRLLRTLIDAEMKSGEHKVLWDGRNENGESVAGGIYIYRIKAGGFHTTRKMILAK